MSLLPQRKKSPEEIARLRERIGVPPSTTPAPSDEASKPGPSTTDTFETIVPANHEATVVHTPETVPLSPLPAPAPTLGPRPVHSLKRSERAPSPSPESGSAAAQARPPVIKPIRSLRKSEQAPLSAGHHPESPPDSPLPHQRHSDQEIQEIRRREAIALMNAAPNPKLFPAHPGIILPGYVITAVAAAGFLFYDFHPALTAALIVVSFSFAAFIFHTRPISRHHAAFIAAMSLFTLVFAALHYFPQLRHAT